MLVCGILTYGGASLFVVVFAAVRLKQAVDKVDEMALDTASTKTTRIRG